MSAIEQRTDSPSPALEGKVVLVTGGTGSFGSSFVKHLLDHHAPSAVRIYSRDELKQAEMSHRLADDRLRFLLGDVRSAERLHLAMSGVDVVVHAAALKQVPACEYNPFEAVQTNIVGAENIVRVAIAHNVPKIIALSTDKAVNPINLYGATKLCAEKIFTQGNTYSASENTRFACVRYGNVVGSRGSVIPLFIQQAADGVLTITDSRMTRFWITLEQATAFVVSSLSEMRGGEIFVPRIPSMRVTDLAQAIAPQSTCRLIGIRPGEKLHEVLITEDEARHGCRFDGYFVIYPSFPFWESPAGHDGAVRGEELPTGFRYTSDSNEDWLTPAQIRGWLEHLM